MDAAWHIQGLNRGSVMEGSKFREVHARGRNVTAPDKEGDEAVEVTLPLV